MTEYTLRKATERDVPEILYAEQISFTDPWSEGMILSCFEDGIDLTLITRISDGAIVGYSVVDRRVDGEAELHNIAVLPEYRGKGLSTLLMDKMISDVNEADVIFLEVRASNTAAKGLYKKYGFTEIGIRRNYYKNPTEDAIIMQRRTGI